MKKIPTAEEFFNKRSKDLGFENWTNLIVQQEWDTIDKITIEFAKLHVEAALKAASEKGYGLYENEGEWRGVSKSKINKKSILNAYPLTNIK
jgi:hypothetical protein